MPLTDVPDLRSPEFAGVRAQLARAFIEHKADIGVCALMMTAMATAMGERRQAWLLRNAWFVDLVNELLEDLPARSCDA